LATIVKETPPEKNKKRKHHLKSIEVPWNICNCIGISSYTGKLGLDHFKEHEDWDQIV